MKDSLNDLMKQAQQVQEQMKQMQENLHQTEVEGEAGAGLVKVTLNGRFEAKKVTLDPSLLTEPKQVIEDLICGAINDAVQKVEQQSRNKVSDLTSGLSFPFNFGPKDDK